MTETPGRAILLAHAGSDSMIPLLMSCHQGFDFLAQRSSSPQVSFRKAERARGFRSRASSKENPINFYTRIFRNVSAAYQLSLQQNARFFAMLHLAYADALIPIMDSKYHFNFWRPYTAIHAGDTDGNPLTDPDLL